MTSLPERAISIIAPNHCFGCSKESNILCDACLHGECAESLDTCFLCSKPTAAGQVCQACKAHTTLGHVWVATEYRGVIRQVIRAYKFGRLQAAHRPLASAIDAHLPYLEDVTVAHIPTATNRVRQRGYDHAKLLAQEVARRRSWRHATLLRRRHNLRQVGSGRAERLQQAQGAFEPIRPIDVAGRHILLIDDVVTSGATLMAAAGALSAAGARQIDAAVVAFRALP